MFVCLCGCMLVCLCGCMLVCLCCWFCFVHQKLFFSALFAVVWPSIFDCVQYLIPCIDLMAECSNFGEMVVDVKHVECCAVKRAHYVITHLSIIIVTDAVCVCVCVCVCMHVCMLSLIHI